jgi:hypothetical protein
MISLAAHDHTGKARDPDPTGQPPATPQHLARPFHVAVSAEIEFDFEKTTIFFTANDQRKLIQHSPPQNPK